MLLREIDKFLRKHPEMNATKLGKQAVNDPALVTKLRRGRRMWPENVQRVMSFMGGYAAAKRKPRKR